MAKSRTPAWTGTLLIPAGLLLAAVSAVWIYLRIAAPPLHPDPARIPSVMQTAPPPKFAPAVERACTIIRARMAEQNLPGLSVAAGTGENIIWTEAFGFADIKSRTPVTPSHRFRIGTASSALTAAGARLLVEEGRLSLNSDVRSYVPVPFARARTVGSLLRQRAAIPGASTLFKQHCDGPAEAVSHLGAESSKHPWILLSAAMEAAAAQGFAEFMRQRVFGPMGMHDTSAETEAVKGDDDHPVFNLIRERFIDPRALGRSFIDPARRPVRAGVSYYVPRFGSNARYGMHLMRPMDLSCYAGSGAFLSTPADLVRFAMAHGGSHPGDLPDGTVASVMTFPESRLSIAVTSSVAGADTAGISKAIAQAFAENRLHRD